ncbi:MAG TPA: hypothetical protein VIT65_10175 [Microlunatus sp.]
MMEIGEAEVKLTPVLEAQIGETEGVDDYVSISGSPRSVIELLRLLIGWYDNDDDEDDDE